MWDLPRRGLEHVSTALAGGFLTTAPPGKLSQTILYVTFKTTVGGFLGGAVVESLPANVGTRV